MIKEFQGEYRFLSNFYFAPVEYGELLYTSSEAAYQAMKSSSPRVHKVFAKLGPNDSKVMGNAIQIRSDWDAIKDHVMYGVVKAKFAQNEDLQTKLLDTEDMEIIEGNRWNDTYWGVCLKTGVGQNRLGKILMTIRNQLKMYGEL